MMKTSGLPRKFLSRREKRTNEHHASNRQSIVDYFRPDNTRQADHEDSQRQADLAKRIDDVRERAIETELDPSELKDDHIKYALETKYAANNVERAIELLLLQKKTFEGRYVQPYSPNVQMLGAENRGNVTCYLDALLFAMFAKLESFECMLKTDIAEDAPRKLAALLRLWVNMLRSGKLIETDMTQHIQDALASCGWTEARLLEQQDTSEAFAFITETLQLPLLPLQVDLFHHGKNDDADHKVVYERLLNLAVPSDVEGKGVKLEDCLEEYFNTRVDVLRDSLDDKKTGDRASIAPSPITPLTPDTSQSEALEPSAVCNEKIDSPTSTDAERPDSPPLERRWTVQSGLEQSVNEPSTASRIPPPIRPNRSRTESIIQRVVLDEKGEPSDPEAASMFQRAKKRASVVKAVTIPAWQFFKLIPWHSPANKEPQSDVEVARHFSQRPVVGICLKRYMMDGLGKMQRQNTFIDIPDSLRLPHFIADERGPTIAGLNADYKLVLQSVVCHRGDSVHSGHYVSFCRVAPKLLTENRRYDNDPPPDYEEAQWVKFDDLSVGERVQPVDDIKQSLKEDMPYLLFYQIVPIVEVASSSSEDQEARTPPPYADATVDINVQAATQQDDSSKVVSRQPSSYFDNLSFSSSSMRVSVDQERPPRQSFADDEGFLSPSRPDSIVGFESITSSAARTPEGTTPAATPGEDNTAQRLSRAAAKFKNGKRSRPQSREGESRLSLTISRFGLGKAGKERQSISSDTDQEFEFVEAEGISEKGAPPGKDPNVSARGKSKTRADKGKGKDKNKGDLPDRECIVQ